METLFLHSVRKTYSNLPFLNFHEFLNNFLHHSINFESTFLLLLITEKELFFNLLRKTKEKREKFRLREMSQMTSCKLQSIASMKNQKVHNLSENIYIFARSKHSEWGFYHLQLHKIYSTFSLKESTLTYFEANHFILHILLVIYSRGKHSTSRTYRILDQQRQKKF